MTATTAWTSQTGFDALKQTQTTEQVLCCAVSHSHWCINNSLQGASPQLDHAHSTRRQLNAQLLLKTTI